MIRKSMIWTMMVLLSASLAKSALAFEGGKEGGGACQADMQKFCGDVKPGEGRIINCMKTHESELSQSCKEMVAHKKEEFKKGEGMKGGKEGNWPCKADAQKFCGDVKPGEGRIINCLQSHQAELASECSQMMSKKMEHEKKHEGMMMKPEGAKPQ